MDNKLNKYWFLRIHNSKFRKNERKHVNNLRNIKFFNYWLSHQQNVSEIAKKYAKIFKITLRKHSNEGIKNEKQKLSQLESSIGEKNEQIKSLEKKKQNLSQQLEQSKRNKNEQIKELEKEKQKLSQQLESSIGEKKELSRQLASRNGEKNGNIRSLEKEKEKLSQLESSIREKNEQIKSLENKKQKLSQQLEKNKRNKNEQINELENKINELLKLMDINDIEHKIPYNTALKRIKERITQNKEKLQELNQFLDSLLTIPNELVEKFKNYVRNLVIYNNETNRKLKQKISNLNKLKNIYKQFTKRSGLKFEELKNVNTTILTTLQNQNENNRLLGITNSIVKIKTIHRCYNDTIKTINKISQYKFFEALTIIDSLKNNNDKYVIKRIVGLSDDHISAINEAIRIIDTNSLFSEPEIYEINNPGINRIEKPEIFKTIIQRADRNIKTNILLLGVSGAGKTYIYNKYIKPKLSEYEYKRTKYIWGMANPFYEGPTHFISLLNLDNENELKFDISYNSYSDIINLRRNNIPLKTFAKLLCPVKYNDSYVAWTPFNENSSRAQKTIWYEQKNRIIKITDFCGIESPNDIWNACQPQNKQGTLGEFLNKFFTLITKHLTSQNFEDIHFYAEIIFKERTTQKINQRSNQKIGRLVFVSLHGIEKTDHPIEHRTTPIDTSRLTNERIQEKMKKHIWYMMKTRPLELLLLILHGLLESYIPSTAFEKFIKSKNALLQFLQNYYIDDKISTNMIETIKRHHSKNGNTTNEHIKNGNITNEHIKNLLNNDGNKQICMIGYIVIRCLEGFYITPSINLILFNMIHRYKSINKNYISKIDYNKLNKNINARVFKISNQNTNWAINSNKKFYGFGITSSSFVMQSHLLYSEGLGMLQEPENKYFENKIQRHYKFHYKYNVNTPTSNRDVKLMLVCIDRENIATTKARILFNNLINKLKKFIPLKGVCDNANKR